MYLSPGDLSILLVEPSTTQRKIIINQLAKEDINHVEEADSIESAIKVMGLHAPDLVVSALHFSDGTAMSLINQMREDGVLKEVPFMLVSSECRKEQLEQFKQAGVVAILPKPFDPKHLTRAIKSTIDLLSPEELELDHFDIASIRTLLVDDSKMARKYVRKVLENLGIQQFVEAENGMEAAKIIQQQSFDLVVTDFNMPEMDGKQLSRYIREHSDQSHVPILMVTSESNESHLANIEQAGVNAMCDKPFEPENVRQLLYSIIEQ